MNQLNQDHESKRENLGKVVWRAQEVVQRSFQKQVQWLTPGLGCPTS